jgi:hypothetical protein
MNNERLGFFVHVPQRTSVTVNGITYTNESDSSPTPFFIGPLEDFAVVELLSQPLFFFRHEGSLKYKVTTRRAAQEEIDRRDGNGDVSAENVTVRWLQLETLEAALQQELNEADITEVEFEQSQDTGVQPVEERHFEEDEYSDAFTDDGKPIENPCTYIRPRLKLHMEQRLASLIPRVIAAINHRQPVNAGFSFVYNSTIFRPGRTLLTALTKPSGRHLLLAAQIQQPDKSIRVNVLYPMIWHSTRDQRAKIHQDLRRWLLASESDEQVASHLLSDIEWVPCAQSMTLEGTFTYTVLNAWALAMGLELNPAFTPINHGNEAFFIHAGEIFHLAFEDALTWKTLLAFLRCTRFVKPGVTGEDEDSPDAQLPAKNRRFDLRKRPFEALIVDQITADANVSEQNMETEQIPVWLEDGILNSRGLAEDLLTHEERDGLAQLVYEGNWRLQDTVEQLRQRLAQRGGKHVEPSRTNPPRLSSLVEAPQQDVFAISEDSDPCGYLRAEPKRLPNGKTSTEEDVSVTLGVESRDDDESAPENQKRYATLAEGFKPCEYLRKTLNALLADERVQDELQVFRSGHITTYIGAWIEGEEAALAISAVSMAINEMQSMEEGFSIVQQYLIETCGAPDWGGLEGASLNAIHPGRPLIAPIAFENHLVLLLAQFDDQGRPTISILDSLFYHYDKESREGLFQLAWRVLCRSSWWRGFFADKKAFDRVKPTSATWVQVARQPTTNECGYFTILNAWSLALGLELNPDVRLRWTDSFFQEMQDVIHLVRLGYADWELIFAFLRCHDFVRDGVVPENRRFARTHDTRSEDIYGLEFEGLLYMETQHWTKQNYQTEAFRRMMNCNRVPSMSGRLHNGPKAFPSDNWVGPNAKQEYATRLLRFGLLNVDHTEKQLRAELRDLMKTRVENSLKKLQSASSPSGKSEVDGFVQAIREEISSHYEGMDSDIQTNPAKWIDETIGLYEYIRKNARLRAKLGKSGVAKVNDWKRFLFDSELNLAMASVLEAIDNLQSGLHVATGSETPFAGGFSLTTSTNIQMGLSGAEGAPLSRPRRAWLIPLVASQHTLLPGLEKWADKNGKVYKAPSNPAGGHSFLVLVQEMPNYEANDPPGTHFEINIFDSCLQPFQNVREFFRERVEDAAHALGWSTHRNNSGESTFDGQLYVQEELPQQAPGGYQCGHHVLINAWIIAMGLRHNEGVIFNDTIYAELYALAQAATTGILDWRTLVAWFFRHGLTFEREFDSVPENRRFGFTFRQNDEIALQDRISQQYEVADQALAFLDCTEVPYDHMNNFVEFGVEDEEDIENMASQFGLERRIDEELDLLGHSRGIKRKWEEGPECSLDFLNRYEVYYGGRKEDTVCYRSSRKSRRMTDHLSFLDVY